MQMSSIHALAKSSALVTENGCCRGVSGSAAQLLGSLEGPYPLAVMSEMKVSQGDVRTRGCAWRGDTRGRRRDGVAFQGEQTGRCRGAPRLTELPTVCPVALTTTSLDFNGQCDLMVEFGRVFRNEKEEERKVHSFYHHYTSTSYYIDRTAAGLRNVKFSELGRVPIPITAEGAHRNTRHTHTQARTGPRAGEMPINRFRG